MGERFEFSEIQANHILDMQLGRLTRLGREQIEEKVAELREIEITELQSILDDDAKLRQRDPRRAHRDPRGVRQGRPQVRCS